MEAQENTFPIGSDPVNLQWIWSNAIQVDTKTGLTFNMHWKNVEKRTESTIGSDIHMRIYPVADQFGADCPRSERNWRMKVHSCIFIPDGKHRNGMREVGRDPNINRATSGINILKYEYHNKVY